MIVSNIHKFVSELIIHLIDDEALELIFVVSIAIIMITIKIIIAHLIFGFILFSLGLKDDKIINIITIPPVNMIMIIDGIQELPLFIFIVIIVALLIISIINLNLIGFDLFKDIIVLIIIIIFVIINFL